MDDRSCGAGGRAGEYRRLSEGEIPESVSSVSLSAAVPFVIGNMETSRSAGYLFSQIRGVARAFAGSSGVPGGEAVSRLCVETDDFEDRSRMKRFGGQVAIGLSDGNVQGVSGGCRRFSHSDTRLFPRQEKPADIVPEEMAVISVRQPAPCAPSRCRPISDGDRETGCPMAVVRVAGGDNIEGPAASRPFDMSCGSAGYGYSNILSISAFVSGLWPRNLT